VFFSVSGSPESEKKSPGRFREVPKAKKSLREAFGKSRNEEKVSGKLSGSPETKKKSPGSFREVPTGGKSLREVSGFSTKTAWDIIYAFAMVRTSSKIFN
jgi:hypothetical protein